MEPLGVIARRVLALVRRRRMDDELAEEIRWHIAMRRDRLLADGVDPEEAEREARRAFGNATAVRERARDVWQFGAIESLIQDVRYAVRLLVRAPGFAAAAIVSLVIGIGATATVFKLTDAVLLRSLPVTAPGELYSFNATIGSGGAEKRVPGVNDDVFGAMVRAAAPPVASYRIAADVTLATQASAPRTVTTEFVSPNYFELLGITAAAGTFPGHVEDDVNPGRVIISEHLWRRTFHGSTDIVGSRVRVNGEPFVVAGVTRRFRGVVAEHPADLFVPMAGVSVVPGLSRTIAGVIARVDGSTSALAATERLKAIYVAASQGMFRGQEVRVRLVPAGHGVSDVREALGPPLRIGLILAAVLLVVACANTGGLLVARFAARQGEFGVRLALGAGRGRLARQLLVEALVLAALAAAFAVLLATLAAPALVRAAPIGQVPPDFDLPLDWRLVVFTAVVAVLASLGSAGACLARMQVASAPTLLASNARTIVRGRRQLVDRLIGVQVCCAVVLIATAGAMAQTMNNLLDIDPGFDVAGIVSVDVDTSARRLEPGRLYDYFSRLTARVSAVQGVAGATVAQVGLMSGAATTGTVDVPGFVPRTDDDRWVRMFFVGPGFFEVTGMHLLAGEVIDERHLTGTGRVAVVNEQFARFYFGDPARAPGRMANDGIRIVGVVGGARYDSPREAPPRAMFVPFTQVGARPRMTLIVRPVAGLQVAAAVTTAIRDFDPTARVSVATGPERLAATLARERFVAFLVAALSLFGICLSSAGLYGSVSYALAERRKELAVRVALGATRRDLLSLILERPLRTTLTGVAFGLPAAWMAMRLLGALLFEIPPFDPAGLASSAAIVVALTLAATIYPARRSFRINAQECLKCE